MSAAISCCMWYISQPTCRTNIARSSTNSAVASADPESVDLRYERILKDGRTSRPEYRMRSRLQVSVKSFRFVYVPRRSCAFTWIGFKLKEDDARDRESDGKKERERGKSGRPSKTGWTGFSGRVGESLYSVSLFLCTRFYVACTLESVSDTSACSRELTLGIC